MEPVCIVINLGTPNLLHHSYYTNLLFLLVHSCNRWNVQARADKDVEKARSTMEKEYVNKAYQDLETQHSKFEHYHERYNNHLQSLDVSECK